MGHYRTAQICLNGHLITDSADTYPEFRKNFCQDCGSKTIMTCQECNTKILGDYYVEGFFGVSDYEVPLYCHNCGKPYPWTKEKLDVAKELLEFDSELSNEDKNELSKNIEYLVSDTPRTQLAATKFKKFLSKAGSTTATAVRDVLVDIASETAKKIIWP